MCTTDALFCEDATALVDALDELRRAEAALHAERVRLLDRLARVNAAHEERLVIGVERPGERATFVERSTTAQVACVLRISERAAGGLVRDARMLVGGLSATLGALERGELSYRHAAIVVEEARALPDEAVPMFEAAALAGRTDAAAGRFGARCRRIRERMHPRSIDDRALAAERSRRVDIDPARDGMAWLTAYLPAMQAELVHVLLTGVARDQREGGDARTLDQLRADALVDAVLHGGAGSTGGSVAEGADAIRDVRATVSITVPALTLLGAGDEPATLDGYGPIPLETASVLAAGAASWRRILTHPVTGSRVAFDRATYRVPAELREQLIARDETCRFPGCGRRARGCDIDHTVAWERGGRTDHDNLAHLCRKHHRLKHHTPWEYEVVDDERVVWTDPAGREYDSAAPGAVVRV